ncbi:hypothetical protein G6F60_011354 [Rhizopus arrhizus]|nr:hypothetical protein G6F61_011063 [Rhizopus arrhizus]KAG1393659.1 hypothetical protein G6F60_011354 [Rhizopus arrhizus]
MSTYNTKDDRLSLPSQAEQIPWVSGEFKVGGPSQKQFTAEFLRRPGYATSENVLTLGAKVQHILDYFGNKTILQSTAFLYLPLQSKVNRLTCLDIFQGLEYAKEPAVFLNKDYSVSFAHFLADTSKVQALKDCVGEPLEHAQRVVDSLVAVAQTRMVLVVGQLLLKKWFKWRVAAYGVVLPVRKKNRHHSNTELLKYFQDWKACLCGLQIDFRDYLDENESEMYEESSEQETTDAE